MTSIPFPIAVFLLLPEFLFINSVFLVSRFRRLPAFQGTIWSLIVSLVLVVVVYPVYARTVGPPPGRSWPGLLEILADPTMVPGHVWVALYGTAILLGLLGGYFERRRAFEKALRWMGIDLSAHGVLWEQLLRTAEYIRVYLRDGTLLFGWPEYYAIDQSHTEPALYLSRVQIWNPDKAGWSEMDGTSGVLVNGAEITRIEFLVTRRDE